MFIKIFEVAEDGGGRIKIGASMKVVDQDTGADLDPDNLAAVRCAFWSSFHAGLATRCEGG